MLDFTSLFKKFISHKLSKAFFLYATLFVTMQISLIFGIGYVNGNLAFATAIVWLIITIPLYIIFRGIKMHKYMYSIINAIIAGLTISSYYSIKSVQLKDQLLVSILVLAFMTLCFAIIAFSDKKNDICIINITLSSIGLAVSLYLWLASNPSLGSYLVFSLFINMCFFISLNLKRNDEEDDYINVVNRASLIMFGGVFLIVLMAITDGDGLDLIDAGSYWDDGRSRKDSNQ